jgi:predicted permease
MRELNSALVAGLARDVRYRARALRRAPGFTLVVILTLALGIGATTAVFSVLNGVLLKPLPFPDPDSLVSLEHTAPGLQLPAGARPDLSASQLFTYREHNRTLQTLGTWSAGSASVTGAGTPEEVKRVLVSAGTLETLGVPAAIGRWFSREDLLPGGASTVLLMHGYWQRRFGGDAGVVGRTLVVDGTVRTIVGVMPASFHFLDQAPDLILPQRFERSQLHLGGFNYKAVARLRPGVTLAQANADIARMVPIWLGEHPAPRGTERALFESFDMRPALRPLAQSITGHIRDLIWVLMATIVGVLLMACANVANLLLVRGEGLQREIAIRVALGASWRRIAREMLIESLMLAVAGGAIGLAVAFITLQGLLAMAPATLPRQQEIGVDAAVLTFTTAIALLSGLLFACLPILKLARPQLTAAMGATARTQTDTRERRRIRNALVVLQVALALTMLVASGLMIRSFVALRAVQPGFANPDTVQLVTVTIPSAQAPDSEVLFRMQREMRDRLAALPGVTMVSFANAAPMQSGPGDGIEAEDGASGGATTRVRRYRFVAPRFFQTVGVPLIAGRDLTWADMARQRHVAVVSENLARELWADPQAALGKRIRDALKGPWREVVGVVGDTRDDGMHRPAPSIVYWPAFVDGVWGQSSFVPRTVTFVVRSPRTGTESFSEDLHTAIWAVNDRVPLTQVSSLGDVYHRSMSQTSFMLVMLGVAGGMALLLGTIGIYGIVAYAVTQRRREIGIRLALGAPHGQLQRMFVREGVGLAAIGVATGLLIAAAGTRLMASLLFGVTALDPLTLVAVAAGLLGAAALASYLPAMRTTSVAPVDALRSD